MWKERFSSLSSATPMPINPREELPTRADCLLAEWKCLNQDNQMRIGIDNALKGISPQIGDMRTTVKVRSFMSCSNCYSLFCGEVCTAEDFTVYNDTAQKCV